MNSETRRARCDSAGNLAAQREFESRVHHVIAHRCFARAAPIIASARGPNSRPIHTRVDLGRRCRFKEQIVKCYCPVIGPNSERIFSHLSRIAREFACCKQLQRPRPWHDSCAALSTCWLLAQLSAQGCSRELEVNCTASDLFLLVYCSALLLAAIDFKVPESYL